MDLSVGCLVFPRLPRPSARGIGVLALLLMGLGFHGITLAQPTDPSPESASNPVSGPPITCRVDHWGYHINAPKSLLLEGIAPGTKIKAKLLDPNLWDRLQMNKGRPMYVFNNKKDLRWVTLGTDNAASGPENAGVVLDFSAFKLPGDYQLEVNGQRSVCDVRVSEYVYWDALRLVMRTWLHQRSGTEIIDRETKLAHTISHTHDALLPIGQGKPPVFTNVIGGWYDTGSNFTKSVAENALSAAKVLSFYHQSPKAYSYMSLSFPNVERVSHPDVLHQMKYGLDWLLTMQAEDGHFYAAVAGDTAQEPLAPEDDSQPRFIQSADPIAQVKATAMAAATLAEASRVFKNNDLSYSVKTALAAESAWRWLTASPRPAVVSPETLPQRFWAATELAVTTGKPIYTTFVQQNIDRVPLQLFSLKNPALLGGYHYALQSTKGRPKTNPLDPKLQQLFTTRIVDGADGIQKRLQANPYGLSVQPLQAESNAVFAEQLGVLMMAYDLTGNTAYRDSASTGLHYLLGLNPLGQSYVTGLVAHDNDLDVKAPFHKGMKAWGMVIPGYLVSGANPKATDGVTPAGQGLRSYTDSYQATDSNATALRYNASLAFVLAELNTSMNLAGATAPDALRQLLQDPKPWQPTP